MAFTLSTGATVSIAKTYGTQVNMTALTNATEAVATLAVGHGVTVGDYLEISSGWGRIDKMVVRAKTVVSNDVTFEKVDTSNTSRFPAGAGVGTIRRITAWTQITQVKDISSSGGDLQFADATSLSDEVQRQVPTTRTAVTMNMTVFDDPTLAWYSDVTKASDASVPFGLRIDLVNGSKLVANAYWSLQKVPMIAKNEVLGTQLSMTYAADPIRYAA